MLGLQEPGSRVMVSRSSNPKRKLPRTLELVDAKGTWVGVNTMRPNAVVAALLQAGELPFKGSVQREVNVGKSRLDFFLPDCDTYLEVKNTTLAAGATAQFPDAVTSRGARHMAELTQLAENHHACVLFFINRADCTHFDVARHIDPAYAAALEQARDAGVQVYPLGMSVDETGFTMRGELPTSWANLSAH